MEKSSIGHYRSHDPPKNFAIHVKLWKVTTGSLVPSATHFQTTGLAIRPEIGEDVLELGEKEDQSEEQEREEAVIHWQEKLFSEREFHHFSDQINCINPLDQKYHEDIEKLKSTYGDRPNRRIFTYVDSDSHSLLEEIETTTIGDRNYQSRLVSKMAQVKHGLVKRRNIATQMARKRFVVENPSNAVKSAHVLTTPTKSMQIVVDLSAKEATAGPEDEHVICNIVVDANGLIVVKPDIELKEILTIETYHDSRAIYQYSLEDASTPMKKSEKEQESRLFKELYTRHAELMASQVGSDFAPVPRANELFVYVFGEIVSAKNFEYDNIHVHYHLDLPDGWETGNPSLSGITQSCRMNSSREAYFSYPFEFQLMYSWKEGDPEPFMKWPTLYMEVASVDSWQRYRCEGYGFCQLSDVPGSVLLEIDTWRPKGDGLRPEMDRFFIGGSPQLQDWTYVRDSISTNDGINSRFYFKTISSGTVTLRMNTVLQSGKDNDVNVPSKSRWQGLVKRAGGFASAIDGLAQVLDAFHVARRRMLSARSTLPSV